MNPTLCKIGEELDSSFLFFSAGWSGSLLSLAEGEVTPRTPGLDESPVHHRAVSLYFASF